MYYSGRDLISLRTPRSQKDLGTQFSVQKKLIKNFEARKACLRNAPYVASPFDFDRAGDGNS
jgi:hypothetical protein